MRFVKWAGAWLIVAFIIVALEKKTGIFTKIFTLNGKVATPLIA